MADTDYQSALKNLNDRINYERSSPTAYTTHHYRLDRMRELLERLDNPQQRYPIIHIAGTKGKGTTAHLIYDGLRANNLQVGIYTSPHLLKVEERFQFDGQLCNESEMTDLIRRALIAAKQVEAQGSGRPTFFEITTAMGLLYFAERRAECVVLEVGLGGRLDSTNVCLPILTLITSISLDHQAQLGATISLIAREKAGIIKPNIPIICTARHADAREVIEQVAQAQSAPLSMIDRDFSVSWECNQGSNPALQSAPVAQIHYDTAAHPPSEFSRSAWPVSMLGRHQADNVAAALTALEWLTHHTDWQLSADRIREAFQHSQVPGRLQIVGTNPTKIIDTAHNPASVAAAVDAILTHFGPIPISLVFASSKDKDYRTMLELLLPHCHHVFCTAFQKNPRAVSPDELAKLANAIANSGNPDIPGQQPASNVPKLQTVQVAASPAEAWQAATMACPAAGLVLAVGSFFLAAELLEM
jgi:dihydrofolate synthase/folylpolyglutamate synthase